jgi:hypothetical protein
VVGFGKQAYNKDGLQSYCKMCTKEYQKQYRLQKGQGYAEKEREQARNYIIKHKQPEQSLAKLDKAIERCHIANVEVPYVSKILE